MSFNTDLKPAVEAQLEKMANAPVFRRKPRVRSFLEYTVRQTLDQQQAKLKEYSIAVEVFNRPEDFDPRLDSIVRVEARRLRATVDRYYETDGRNDDLWIRYRRGNYVPVFEHRSSSAGSSLCEGIAQGVFATGAMLVGILAADASATEVYSRFAAGQATASVTILRAPFEPETLEMIRSGDPRVVVLKPANAEDLKSILGQSVGA